VNVAAERGYAAEVVAVYEALDTDNPQVGESAADVALVVSPELADASWTRGGRAESPTP
jgi:hypothetical protein